MLMIRYRFDINLHVVVFAFWVFVVVVSVKWWVNRRSVCEKEGSLMICCWFCLHLFLRGNILCFKSQETILGLE